MGCHFWSKGLLWGRPWPLWDQNPTVLTPDLGVLSSVSDGEYMSLCFLSAFYTAPNTDCLVNSFPWAPEMQHQIHPQWGASCHHDLLCRVLFKIILGGGGRVGDRPYTASLSQLNIEEIAKVPSSITIRKCCSLSCNKSSVCSLQPTIVNSPDKEIIEEYRTVHSIDRLVRTRLEIVVGTLTGSWSETAQVPWMLGSATPECYFWLTTLGCRSDPTWARGMRAERSWPFHAFLMRSKPCPPPHGEFLNHRKEGPVIRKPPKWQMSTIAFMLMQRYLAKVSPWTYSWLPTNSNNSSLPLCSLEFWLLIVSYYSLSLGKDCICFKANCQVYFTSDNER